MPYDRQTWDLTSVLYAVEPKAGYFDLSETGKITIDETGMSIFRPDKNGKHQYLIIPTDKIETTLKAIVNRTVGNTNFKN